MKKRIGLSLRDWPSDWQARWNTAITPAADTFGDEGRGAHWAPDTQIVIRKRLELFFGHLASTGMLDVNRPCSGFLTEDILRPWIETLQNRLSPVTVAGYLRDLRIGLRTMDPYIDDRILKLVTRRLECRARPTRNKEKILAHPRDLYRAALARMDRVELDDYEKGDVRAVQYGDGLAIAIVTASAIRLKNLVGIRIGNELRRGEGRYRLVFSAEHMKSRRPFAADLPACLTPYIECFIDRHRAQLLQGRQCDHLFISCYRRPMSRQSMHLRFKAATEKEIGTAIGPHRIRDLAVTCLAIDHPDKIGIAPALLHHAQQRTTRIHYNQADQLSAGRDYAAALTELRREALAALKKGKLFDHEPVD